MARKDEAKEAPKIVGPVCAGPARSAAVVERADGTRAIEYIVASSPGVPLSRLTLPLPPTEAQPVAIDWNGPGVVCADGSTWHWGARGGGGAWLRVGNLLGAEATRPRVVRPFADIADAQE